MAPKRPSSSSSRGRESSSTTKRRKAAEVQQQQLTDSEGIFSGMVVYLVAGGVQPRRLQIWKHKLLQMGATIKDDFSKGISHILANHSESVLQELGYERLKCFKGNILHYDWLENCLKSGKRLSEELYTIKNSEGNSKSGKYLDVDHYSPIQGNHSNDSKVSDTREDKIDNPKVSLDTSGRDAMASSGGNGTGSICTSSSSDGETQTFLDASKEESSLLYNPPDLNRNITAIFGKLINIYRALGDDWRSFSYYKAIPAIEKLPFKIESVDQVKHLPAIGRSMQDHIHEIVTTGKLSKLEHFEKDEKVKTVSLFGEVWGIGPATATKLYDKGYRTLQDLEKEDSLTNAQRLGLKYFDDIKKRIPRHEVKEMEALLQKAGEVVLPGVVVVCGGSYRRGKASCGDMDIVITHPDRQSHKGFLSKYVQYLKEISFLREDLIFSIHSIEGTDSGVDTYFGLCTYPGRELRHRIDFKVYPRDIYAFGLIAWTGNDVLNRRLRLLAESKGYRLDDTGLFFATQSSGGKKGVRSSTSISCMTEKEVFDMLGFPWLEPHERNL